MTRRYPTPTQQRTLWNAVTALALVILGAILVGLVWMTGNVLAYLQPVLVPLALAGIVAFLLQPAVEWIEARGLSRIRSIFVVFAGFALVAITMGLLIVPALLTQIASLREDFPQRVESLESKAREWAEWPVVRPGLKLLFERATPAEPVPDAPVSKAPTPKAPVPGDGSAQPTPKNGEGLHLVYEGSRLEAILQEQDDTIRRWILKGLRAGGDKVLGFIGYAVGFLMVPVYLFYFLKESAAIGARWQDYVPLKRSWFKTEVVETLREMNNYLVAFFRGQVLVSLIDGLLTGIALQIMGLPYAIVIGMALAILGVMPFVGFLVTLLPAMVIAAVHWGDWQHPLIVAGIFFVVQQIDGLLIQPKIVGDSVGLHPMTIIFSILFWSLLLGGFLGALLAIPLTASVKVLFTRYIWESRLRPEEDPEPADPIAP